MDGTVVAINVQCPNMEVLIARDLDTLSFGIAILGRIAPRKLRRSNLAAFFAEFQRYTHTELDFRAEAQMMTRLGQNFTGHDVVIIPKNYPALKTRRILTMDRVATKSLRQDLLTQVEAGHAIVFRIGWPIYEFMCEIPLMQAKTLTKNPQKKMRIATDMFRQFPFRSPEFGWRDVDPGVDALTAHNARLLRFLSNRMPRSFVFGRGARLITRWRRNGVVYLSAVTHLRWVKITAIFTGILISPDPKFNKLQRQIHDAFTR